MLLVDDLIKLILEGLVDYVDRAYLERLQDRLTEIRLLYELGEINEDEFRKEESELAEAIGDMRTKLLTTRKSTDVSVI